MDNFFNNLLNRNGVKCIAFIKEKNEDIYHAYEGQLIKVGEKASITVSPIADCSKKLIGIYNELIQSEVEYKNEKIYYYHNGFSTKNNDKECVLCADNLKAIVCIISKFNICKECLDKLKKIIF